jgi:hypothetical protein
MSRDSGHLDLCPRGDRSRSELNSMDCEFCRVLTNVVKAATDRCSHEGRSLNSSMPACDSCTRLSRQIEILING